MESNKNDNNNTGGDEHEQPPRSAQKCTLNELANDENKPAGEDQNCSSKTNHEDRNDLLDLEVCTYLY
jgi:hypothetical protein